MSLMVDVNLTFECTAVHDDVDTGAGFHEVMRGGPSSESGDDDDEQIVRCLQHVKDACLVFACLASRSDWFVHFRLLI
jgi:hypothetical protein